MNNDILRAIEIEIRKDPRLVIEVDHLCKNLKQEFKSKKIFYGHGGARHKIQVQDEDEIQVQDELENQNQTESETTNSNEAILEGILSHKLFSVFDTRKPSYEEFSTTYRMYCGMCNIAFTNDNCDKLWKYYLSTWED